MTDDFHSNIRGDEGVYGEAQVVIRATDSAASWRWRW